MLKKNLKRILSVILTAVIALTAVPLGSVISFAAESKTADKVCSDLQFWAPEAIYLYPNGSSWVNTTSTPFQYYINNNADGTVKSGYDTTGYIYFSYANAENTTLSARFMNESFSTLSGGKINIGNTTPGTNATITFDGTSPDLAANVNGCYIEWTLSFKDKVDGKTKTAYAYTYVYKPYVVPVGGFVKLTNTRYNDSYAQSITWISGVHSITVGSLHDDGGYYPNYSGGKGFSAFITKGTKSYYGNMDYTAGKSNSLINCTNGWSAHYEGAEVWNLAFMSGNSSSGPFFQTSASNTSAKGWGSTSMSGSTFNVRSMDYWWKEKDAENILVNLTSGASGNITIDTSRYSNLKQIPNLAGGLMVTDDEDSDEGGHWLVADASGITDGRNCDYWTGSSTCSNYLGYKNYAIARQGANSRTDWGDGSGGSWEEEGVKYAGAWPRTLLGTTNSQGGKYMFTWMGWYGNNDDGTDFSFNRCTVDLNATYYNKAKLRSAVETAIKKMPSLGVNGISGGSIKSCYFDADTNYKWTALQTAYKAAVIALSKIDSTANCDTLATNLTNALNALCTKWSLNANGGTLSGTTSGWVTIGTNQKHTVTPSATGSRTGYTLAGWSSSPTGTASKSVSLGYNDTAYAIWKVNTITLKYDGNGNTGGAVPAESTFSYGSRVEVAGKLTRSYKVSYNYTGATSGNSAASATADYTWGGWKSSANGKIYTALDGVTDSFGATSGTVTLTAQWTPTAVKLPSPERTGYTFTGWYTAETGGTKIGDAGSLYTPAADITIYAQWTVNKYAVDLIATLDNVSKANLSGFGSADIYINGNLVSDDCTDYLSDWAFGTTYEAKDIKAEKGYTYEGASVVNGTVGAKTNTILLKFHTNTYTIKFNSNGASGSTTSMTGVRYGANATLNLNGFVKSGYRFLGWAETADGPVKYGDGATVNTLSESDKDIVNLYAKWEAMSDRSYNINVYVMDSTGKYPAEPDIYTFGNQTTGTTVSVNYAEYIPAGTDTTQFYLDTSKPNVTSGTVSGGDSLNLIVYIARKSHQVTYNYSANGGTVASVLSATVYYGGAVSLAPTAAKSGWKFLGWYTSANEETGKTIDSLTMGSTDITLYAVFSCTLKVRSYYIDSAKKNTRSYTDTESTIYNAANSVAIRTYDGLDEFTRNFNDTLCTFVGYTTDAYTGTGDLIGAGEEIVFYSATAGFTDGKILATYCASYDVLIELIHDAEGGVLTGKNSSTGGYLTALATKFAYNASASFKTQTAPVREGYTFIGWAKSVDSAASAYYDTESEITTLYSVTLHAIWLKDWTDEEDGFDKKDAEDGMYVVSGIKIGKDGSVVPVNAEYIYKYSNYAQYTTNYNSYVRAQNNYNKSVDSNRFYYAKLLKSSLDKVRTFVEESLTEENMTPLKSDYYNNFTVSYEIGAANVNGVSAGTHTLAEMNLNHYSMQTLEDAYKALQIIDSYSSDAKAFGENSDSELNNQEAMNAAVETMAKALLNVENAEEAAPEFKVYETAGAIKALTGEDLQAVNFVYTGKGNYTYYCYTNSKTPTVEILVNEAGSRVSYPTFAGVTASANGGYSIGNRDVVNSQYEKYLTAGMGKEFTKVVNGTTCVGADYYSKQSFIKLTPVLTSDGKEVVYTITANDDALNPNYADKSALSNGLGTANEASDILTLSGGTDQTVTAKNTLTVVICYKSASTMDAKCTKWENDSQWLNNVRLTRDRGGAVLDEITGFRDKRYALDDPEFGQANYGSFAYVFKAGTTDIRNNTVSIDTTDVNSSANIEAVCQLLKTPVSTYDSGVYYLRSKQMFADYTKGDKAANNGLGFIWWHGDVRPDTLNIKPQSDSYIYVHLADRWGNTVNKIFKVQNVDSIAPVITAESAGTALVNEEGCSAVKNVDINAKTISIITGYDSTLNGNVYTSTSNTVKLSTGEAGKSFTLGVTDNAGNTAKTTVEADADGNILLSFTDPDCLARPYIFTLGDYEIHLYEGSYKHIKEVKDAVVYKGQKATVEVVTSAQVTMSQLVSVSGSTQTALEYVENSDGTRTWKFDKTLTTGEYVYTVKAKVNGKWIDEGEKANVTVKEIVPECGAVKSVEYTPSTSTRNIFTVTVTGSPEWIQVVNENGGTRTYIRDTENVQNITAADDGEIWTIPMNLPAGEYNIKARYNKVWSELYQFTVIIKEIIPDPVGKIVSVEYTPSTSTKNIFTVTVTESPEWIQVVNENGGTRTYIRDTENVQNITATDGGEIWTVPMNLPEGEYTIRARYNKVWCEPSELIIRLKDVAPDAPVVYSIDADGLENGSIFYGRHELTVTTSTNVKKIRLVSGSGSELTVIPDGTNVQKIDGKLVWKFTKKFSTGNNQIFKVFACTASQPFTDSGVALEVNVLY